MFKSIFGAVALAVASLTFTPANAGNNCIDPVCEAFLKEEIRSLRREVEILKGNRPIVHVQRVTKKHVTKPKRIVRASTTRKVTRPPVVKQSSGLVCWFVKAQNAEGKSAVVLYHGTSRNRGKPIATFGADGWFRHAGGFAREICVARAKIQNLNKIAMCNANGGNDFNRADIEYVLRLGNVGLDDVADLPIL